MMISSKPQRYKSMNPREGWGASMIFVELIDDSLSRNDLDAFFVAFERLEGLFLNLEIKLSGKSHAAHQYGVGRR